MPPITSDDQCIPRASREKPSAAIRSTAPAITGRCAVDTPRSAPPRSRRSSCQLCEEEARKLAPAAPAVASAAGPLQERMIRATAAMPPGTADGPSRPYRGRSARPATTGGRRCRPESRQGRNEQPPREHGKHEEHHALGYSIGRAAVIPRRAWRTRAVRAPRLQGHARLARRPASRADGWAPASEAAHRSACRNGRRRRRAARKATASGRRPRTTPPRRRGMDPYAGGSAPPTQAVARYLPSPGR